MAETIKHTRSELLKTRKRIKLAKKGHELLKKKQDSLVIEFFALLKQVRKERDELQRRYASAQRRMDESRALESDLRIKAAALAVERSAPIEIEVRNIAGVKIPRIKEAAQRREYPVYESIMLQDLGIAYHEVVDAILTVAARETALRKLLIEIRKTKRRAHALEHILLPRLKAALKSITFELEERSREEFNRLKRRKKA